MKRRRPASKAPFVITFVGLAALPACGGKTDSGTSSGGAGGGSGGMIMNPPPPTCPTAPPGLGTTCAGSAQCTYDQCASTGQMIIVACTHGKWAAVPSPACPHPTPTGCPASMPSGGTVCSLPSGTSCSFGDQCCPGPVATCMDGSWVIAAYSCNPPPPPPCPATVPVAGSACAGADPCAYTAQTCSYDLCGDTNPEAVATCDGSTWSVTTLDKCAPLLPCDQLGPCDCFHRSDCQAKSDGCLCQCDYQCAGDPPCDCACGGGTFLGCAPL